MRTITKLTLIASVALAALATLPASGLTGEFDRLRDRGPGVSSSMFGIYIEPRQLVVYPYFEYYRDRNFEYKPAELGFKLDRDFRGNYRASEGLLFLGYGLSDRFALEIEAAVITARLERSPADASGLPAVLEESGIGDVEGQLRWRWARETERRPEFFSYFETVGPTQNKGSLIGTTDWEFQLGAGAIRGLRWGTVSARVAGEYDNGERVAELGELAIEYLRRINPAWRVYGAIEGTGDEIEFITEAQWLLSSRVLVKLNNAFGVTSKAPDWAPEVGVMFSFGGR